MSAPPPTRVLWQPNPGRQTKFLASRAKRALYGGAAGGGKSAALLACPLRWIENPNYRGLYLRRESQYLGDAVDKSKRLYPALGARLVMGPRIVWTFPSGAELWMNHCKDEGDIANYDSFEFSEVLFDELTHFTERQFVGICARLRGTDPTLPYWCRAATNPGGVGHEWVKRRWSAWLDPKHKSPADEGETRWMLRGGEVAEGTHNATSYTFVPALLADNPKVDPAYRAELEELDPLRRKQLLGGDWNAASEGALWTWDSITTGRVAVAPMLSRIIVVIDPNAASEGTADKCDDAGVVVLGRGFDKRGYVLHDASGQMSVNAWARLAIALYRKFNAACIVAERNLGGPMIANTIRAVLLEEAMSKGKREPDLIPIELVQVRGEKVQRSSAARQLYPHTVSHVGVHSRIEDTMTSHDYSTSKKSPGDLDALSLGLATLMLGTATLTAEASRPRITTNAQTAGW